MKIDLLHVEKILDWIKTKIKLNENAVNAQNRTVKRGQVYRCNFGVGIGSEMQKERPAVIIQNDIGNNRSGNTIVIPITHNIKAERNKAQDELAALRELLDIEAEDSIKECAEKMVKNIDSQEGPC